MSEPASLRKRLTAGILAYVVLLSLAVAAHGYFVNESAERLVWESMLESELNHFDARRAADPSHLWTDSQTLTLYGPSTGRAIPPQLAHLPPGVHDEIRVGKREVVTLVRGLGTDRSVLALDITDMEQTEQRLIWSIAVSSAMLVALLALVTYLGVGRLVRPLAEVARAIDSLVPDRRGQRVPVVPDAPREAVVIAQALNEHLGRIDRYVEREREFIRLASHELRTPLAVIVSAAEVGLDSKATGVAPQAQLHNVLRIGRDMQQLVALLLALAREPERLRASAESFDLADLVAPIVEDHRFLATSKELSFEIDAGNPCPVRAPRQIVQAAVDNLVRNAVENSNRGVIRIRTTERGIVVEDPGHGMSDEEMSRIYTRLARAGEVTTGGIGIELIARICAHLGWRLEIRTLPGSGTCATLLLSEGTPGTQLAANL